MSEAIPWLATSRWATPPIRRVSQLGTGHTPSRQHPEYWTDCTVPWITLADVWQLRDGTQRVISETQELISAEGLANSAAVLHPMGSVILSRTASVGFSAIMGTSMATSQDFAVWTCGPNLVPEFLLYVLRAMEPDLRRLVAGSTHKTIYMPDIESLRTPLPLVDQQRRIADFLDDQVGTMDALAASIRARTSLVEMRSMAVLDEAFRFEEGCTTPLLGYKTVLITSGPRGWGDYVGDVGAPFFRSANLRRDSLHPNLTDLARVLPPAGERSAVARSRVRAGDVLVGITGANSGWTCLANDEDVVGAFVSQHVALIRPRHADLRSAWLAHYLTTSICTGDLFASQYGGTKPQLSLPDLRNLRIRVPPISVQDERLVRIEGAMRQCDQIRGDSTKLLGLIEDRKRALITACVKGEFDVSTGGPRAAEAALQVVAR